MTQWKPAQLDPFISHYGHLWHQQLHPHICLHYCHCSYLHPSCLQNHLCPLQQLQMLWCSISTFDVGLFSFLTGNMFLIFDNRDANACDLLSLSPSFQLAGIGWSSTLDMIYPQVHARHPVLLSWFAIQPYISGNIVCSAIILASAAPSLQWKAVLRGDDLLVVPSSWGMRQQFVEMRIQNVQDLALVPRLLWSRFSCQTAVECPPSTMSGQDKALASKRDWFSKRSDLSVGCWSVWRRVYLTSLSFFILTINKTDKDAIEVNRLAKVKLWAESEMYSSIKT